MDLVLYTHRQAIRPSQDGDKKMNSYEKRFELFLKAIDGADQWCIERAEEALALTLTLPQQNRDSIMILADDLGYHQLVAELACDFAGFEL